MSFEAPCNTRLRLKSLAVVPPNSQLDNILGQASEKGHNKQVPGRIHLWFVKGTYEAGQQAS